MFGRNLSLGIESGVFDDAFGLCCTGNRRLGKKIGELLIFGKTWESWWDVSFCLGYRMRWNKARKRSQAT
jgi:hypothetical protein